MPSLVNAFPLSIYQDKIPLDPAEKAQLVEAVMEMNATPKRSRGGTGSWTGDVNGFERLHFDPRFDALFKRFAPHFKNDLQFLRVDPELIRLYYTRSWATISTGDQTIAVHRHMQSHISLVYYLSAPPDSGSISFEEKDPYNQFVPQLFGKHMFDAGVVREPNEFNAMSISLDPSEGDILLFPSKIPHGTVPGKNREPRISIAIDVVVAVRDSSALEIMLPDLDAWQAIE